MTQSEPTEEVIEALAMVLAWGAPEDSVDIASGWWTKFITENERNRYRTRAKGMLTAIWPVIVGE